MSQEKPRHEMTFKKTVYRIPGMEAITARSNLVYRDSGDGPLTIDLYYPPAAPGAAAPPVVLFVGGFPDPVLEAMAGCKLKETAGYVSWGQLVAASGMVGVLYSNHEPVADLERVLAYLRQNAVTLGLDAERIGVWACSGNVPTALGLLMQTPALPLKCALLSYGIMLDPDGSLGVAQAAAQLGFANPAAGKSVSDLSPELPIMIVRAGRDQMPGLNVTIDHLVAAGLARNLPLTVVNHPTAPHSFDLLDDTGTSREVIRRMLAFLQVHLQAQPPAARVESRLA